MREIGPADHDEARAVREVLMVGGHGVLQGMLAGTAAHAHHVAGKGVAERDMRPSLQVLPVLHRPRQVAADVLNGRQGIHVAHQVRAVGNIAFHTVEQSVEPLEGRQVRRNGEHQFRVHDGKDREQVRMDEAGFFMGFPVGHHGARIRLRPGARRRGNGYERKGLADDRKPPGPFRMECNPSNRRRWPPSGQWTWRRPCSFPRPAR